MKTINIPAPVITGVMKNIPPRALGGAVTALMRQMGRRHQRLFRRLADMDDAVIFIEPTDLPHNFVLRLGHKGPAMTVAGRENDPVTARIKGRLESLLDMLEGRSDGDALFFSRDIILTGDTSAIVGLRNILDGEDIQVIAEVLSLAGPFARPASMFLRLTERAAKLVRARMEAFHNTLHPPVSVDMSAAAECRQLRDEVQTLRAHLAKIEAQRKLAERKSA